MSALSRLPRTPATGIIHKWPPIHAMPRSDELAYGQVRRVAEGLTLLVLTRGVGDTWYAMVLVRGAGSSWPHQESGKIQAQTADWLRSLPLVTP